MDCPFELKLKKISEDGKVRLCAFLKNISSSAQLFHHSFMYQASELVLVASSDVEVFGYDYRERKDFDHTMYYLEDYSTLEPNEEVEIDSAFIGQQTPDSPIIAWGPFQFNDLKKGNYSAYVIFESLRDDWTDQKTKIRHEIKNIWLGKLKSNLVNIEID
jgi:hypothetical protein